MGLGVTDHALAALVYSGTTIFSWAQQVVMHGLQAAANIYFLERQKDLYDDISKEQRALIDVSLANYLASIQNNILPRIQGAVDEVPDVAEYVPVNPCSEQGCTIECNISHIVRADTWAQCVSRFHQQSDIARAVTLDPRYVANIDMYSQSVQDLLRGKLGPSDVMDIMTDTSESACLNGRIGGCSSLTNRNLGISRLRAQSAGRAEMQGMMGMLNRDVSPLGRQADIRDMMVTPSQRISLALTQAQLIQNSLQNVFNAAARKPPHIMAELMIELDSIINIFKGEASKAAMVNGFVPDYASVLNPQIQAATNAISENFGSTHQKASAAASNVVQSEGFQPRGGSNPNQTAPLKAVQVSQSSYDAPSVAGYDHDRDGAKSGLPQY